MTATVLTPPSSTAWDLLSLRSAVGPIVSDAVGESATDRLVVDAGDCPHPDAFLAAVVARLMVLERLDVAVAYVVGSPTRATRVYRLPVGAAARDLAHNGTPAPFPLIRDDAASVLVGRARHVGADGGPLLGEGYVDDTRLFDGEVAAVEIEPLGADGDLRGRVARRGWALPHRWRSGRAVQTGGPAVFVEREGVLTPRATGRSTFYPHHVPWRLVALTS
ncbi:hypothetical protein [Gordonia crocea]|uniref:Uncharacterized protein n=1 Tax=Gordonia crocea TaxID=589162 RepID=A0A7I9V1X5_9ACTN|nr:hypothetical protein [Gordonia crocea]GED99151.1 hypothetical protein nbrc107697_31900 [Gordonia crocea]